MRLRNLSICGKLDYRANQGRASAGGSLKARKAGVWPMMLHLNEKQLLSLKNFLLTSEDAQALGGNEYTVDIFELDAPISLELCLLDDGIDVLAAALLDYSDELEGWYISGRIEQAEELRAALDKWNVFSQ